MAGLLAPAGAVWADESPSAAEIDWRPRGQLPDAQRENLPVFCRGGYVQPEAGGADLSLVEGPTGGQPLQASGLFARYEIDKTLVLQGDVRLRQGQFSVTGTEARYDQSRGQMELAGPIVSRGKGFLLTGEQADYDTDSGRLGIHTATFLLHGAEMRGSALSLSRPAPDRVSIQQGTLTTCAPNQNDWSLVASEIDLNQSEGVGTAKHVRLEIKDVPVFYWPYASFPIDERRKTGFLYPSFGTSNTGSGAFVSVPYYLNLAPEYDATLTPQYIHGRGLFNEVEGRYLSPLGQSDLQLGYIGNDQDYRSEVPGSDGERWALDFTTRANLGKGWLGYGDYSVVSDNDYLSDLNRSLDINQETHLQRRGGVRYRDRFQFFEAYLNGFQTIIDRIAEADKPYDQLPEVLYGFDNQWGPLATVFEGQYTWFDRDNTALTGLDRATGQRLRIQPELALPMRALWGYTRPSVTLDHTLYQLDDYTLGDGRFDRTVPVFEWDSGLYFDRQSELFDIPYNQTLEPRLYYAWADADDQSFIPDFDTALKSFSFDQLFKRNRFSGGDRVGDANQLTAAVTTRFNDLVTGAERARLSLGQVYYYDAREVSLAGEGAEARSDSALAGEAVLRPLQTLDIRTSGLWDPRIHKTLEGRSQLVFHSEDYRYLATLGHSYRRGTFEQSDIGAVFPVTRNVSLIGRWVYDSQTDRTAGSLAGIEYNNCCWSVQLVSQNYLTDDQKLENRLLFQIQLKGLGGSGGASDPISDAIYGFEERERRRFGSRY
ncbi:LPS-assembly protein LptD [Marinobacter caseinilyticus]|uniref:LPS-assembly protein LptD n=1 Tax=Marinobacter caseinilyticus TaxID=2692195 RepID=UPI001F24DB07|nr:LPS-assembly protein LptD [Marinobacter caseinilyticus]